MWKTKSVLAKVLLWNILKFYAVKNTKDKGHYSRHVGSHLPFLSNINSCLFFCLFVFLFFF